MRALIAEDEKILAGDIETYLAREDFDGSRFDTIDKVHNGIAALRIVQNDYDLVILDLAMPEADGTQVIEALDLIESPQKRPWVVLITAYPAAYEKATLLVKMRVRALLSKPFPLPELMNVIATLVKERRQLLDRDRMGQHANCEWMLAFSEQNTAYIQTKGLLNSTHFHTFSWSILDRLAAGRQADLTNELANTSDPIHRHWRFEAKSLGKEIFEKLFVGKIQTSFVAAGSSVLHSHDLKICFAGPRDSLTLPLEFLNDGQDYLTLRHPMRRSITGVESKGETNLLKLLNDVHKDQDKLKILLIASNTIPAIDGVDEEVTALHDFLVRTLSPNRCTIDYLPTEKATYSAVMSKLSGCGYHIIHYAGHGTHNQRFPGKSGLYFWEKEGRSGEVKTVTVESLKTALHQKGHTLRFAYLSCCSSAAVANQQALLDDDFLGIADGVIQAGVPAALGFRWPVSDWGGKELALKFYESFLEQGDLDTALFYARCGLVKSGQFQDCGDWLSPVLIMQE